MGELAQAGDGVLAWMRRSTWSSHQGTGVPCERHASTFERLLFATGRAGRAVAEAYLAAAPALTALLLLLGLAHLGIAWLMLDGR